MNKIHPAHVIRRLCLVGSPLGSTVVCATGCFDLLHPSHIDHLQQAKELGDILVVGINSDGAVKELKAGRPLIPFEHRAMSIAALECVDFVGEIDSVTCEGFLADICPDIWVKGAGYKSPEYLNQNERKAVVDNGGRIIICPGRYGYTTTGLIKKIRELPE